MNILFFESSIDPYRGGIQRVTDLLYHYFERKEITCYFAYFLKDNEAIPQDRKLKVNLNEKRNSNCRKYIKYILDKKIDIIINQDQYYDFVLDAYKYIRTNKICKIINCFHLSPNYFDYTSLPIKSRIKNFVYKIFLNRDIRYIRYKLMYNLCDKFVLLSSSFVDDICKILNITEKQKFVHISDPLSFIRKGKIDFDKKEKIVLIISRFCEAQKNLCAAMRIWKEVENKGTNGWKLILGGYGQDEKLITNYILKLGLKEIELIGKVDKSLTYYEKASIFMMTSNYEGFGMTLTEAIQNGCVPIAFDTYTALHDIVSNMKDGIIITKGDENNYSNQLYRLMTDDNLRMSLAKEAVVKSEKFSIESIGNKWITLFYSLIK